MRRKDAAWLERLRSHEPTREGFIFGRDDPDEAFLTPSEFLPKNYDYMSKWRQHLSLAKRGDPDDGLTEEEISVLMESEDTSRLVTVVIFGEESRYYAQYSRLTKVVQRLEDIGLAYIIEYKGGRGGRMLGPDGRPLGLRGCEWAWTPLGLKWVRVRLGMETNDATPKLKLHPSIADVDHYG